MSPTGYPTQQHARRRTRKRMFSPAIVFSLVLQRNYTVTLLIMLLVHWICCYYDYVLAPDITLTGRACSSLSLIIHGILVEKYPNQTRKDKYIYIYIYIYIYKGLLFHITFNSGLLVFMFFSRTINLFIFL